MKIMLWIIRKNSNNTWVLLQEIGEKNTQKFRTKASKLENNPRLMLN